MRVTTGIAKGVRLETIEGQDTRPTADRLKQSMFNMIQFEIAGRRVLELFSGSGQLAIEALSRGAAGAVLVEKNPKAAQVIRRNLERVGFSGSSQVFCEDVFDFLKRRRGTVYDLVLLDPPYHGGFAVKALLALAEGGFLHGGSLLAAETEREERLDSLPGFRVIRRSEHGLTAVSLLRYEGELEVNE